MQFYDRHACKALVSNRKVFLDWWSWNSLVQVFILPFARRCARNLKEKARSGSLSGDFDSRIKVNTFIQTNVLVLPDVYLSLWIRILQKIRNTVLIRKSLLCKPTLRKFRNTLVLELCAFKLTNLVPYYPGLSSRQNWQLWCWPKESQPLVTRLRFTLVYTSVILHQRPRRRRSCPWKFYTRKWGSGTPWTFLGRPLALHSAKVNRSFNKMPIVLPFHFRFSTSGVLFKSLLEF